MRIFLVCLCLFWHASLYASENAAEELTELDLSNRTLAGVLHLYQRAGYSIVFSSSLVKDSHIVRHNPPPGEPIERLNDVLKILNLSLQQQEQTNSWYVVACKDDCADFRQSPSPSEIIFPPKANKIEEVIVTSSYSFDRNIHNDSSTSFDALEIQSAPTLGGDSLQIINSLPGVASQGFSAKPNVRGGVQDELLILFDGVELIDPFHLKDYQSLLSGISSDLVNGLSIHTGGYPAKFGGKMSGVMEIQSPPLPEDFASALTFTPFTTSIKTGGSSDSETFNWIISARRGNLDETLEQVNEDIGIPHFDDFYLSARWHGSSELSVETSYLAIRDDIRLDSLDENEGESLRSLYNSQYGWIKTQIEHDDNRVSKFIVTLADIKNDRDASVFEPNNPDESVGTLMDRRSFDLGRLEYTLNYRASEHYSLESGFRLERVEGNYDYSMSTLRGELATLLGLPRDVSTEVKSSPKGNAGAVFFSGRYIPSEKFSMEAGLRADIQTYYAQGKQTQLSPRTAFRFKLDDNLYAKANIGRFYQAAGIGDLDVEYGSRDFYKPQKSDHYIVGIEYENDKGYSINIEGYRKDVLSPRPRFENVFQPYSYAPDLTPDRILIHPESSEIRGYEVLAQYSGRNRLKAWFSYTRSNAKDDLSENIAISRRWNQKHTIQGGVNLFYNNWVLGSRIHWHSGWRTTEFSDFVTTLNEPVPYEMYNKALPDFFTIDVKISYHHSYSKGELEAYLEVANLTDRNNIGYYEPEINSNSQDTGYDIVQEQTGLFPLIPSFGLSWRF